MEKTRAPEPLRREEAELERDRPGSLGLHRCPYCHDDVAAAESVACQGCLARHHGSCWEESGRCATCSGAVVLRSDGGRPPLTPALVTKLLRQAGYTLPEIRAALRLGSELSWPAAVALSAILTTGALAAFAAAVLFFAGDWPRGPAELATNLVMVTLACVTFCLALVRLRRGRG